MATAGHLGREWRASGRRGHGGRGCIVALVVGMLLGTIVPFLLPTPAQAQILTAAVCNPLTDATAPGAHRIALVIGNANYQHLNDLPNPVHDAGAPSDLERFREKWTSVFPKKARQKKA